MTRLSLVPAFFAALAFSAGATLCHAVAIEAAQTPPAQEVKPLDEHTSHHAAVEAAPSPSTQGTGQQQPQSSMQDMMKMHEQMMAEMKAADAKLDALVRDMNAASGEAKINAVAAVVNELAGRQKAMHEHMGQMHQQMMSGRGMMMRR